MAAPPNTTVLVLGAGASRGVSYANDMQIPSPLDRDYFDLLQRFKHSSKDDGDINDVIRWAQGLPFEYWRSMEQCFYTLHSRSYLAEKLQAKMHLIPSDAELVTAFVNCTGALLRAAHGKRACEYHSMFMDRLGKADAVCSFNYDLVPERALKKVLGKSPFRFDDWIYSWHLDAAPTGWNGPPLLKLHGSFSWGLPKKRGQFFSLNISSWDDLEDLPRYRRFNTVSTKFPIFLPFWDKRIEESPWLGIWRQAYERLAKCNNLIVWGYSLPKTDLKAYQLFALVGQGLGKPPENLCVIDPSVETRDRWRRLFIKSKFSEYNSAEAFADSPPAWWK